MSTQKNGDIISEQIAFSLFDTGKDNSNDMLTQARKTHMTHQRPWVNIRAPSPQEQTGCRSVTADS